MLAIAQSYKFYFSSESMFPPEKTKKRDKRHYGDPRTGKFICDKLNSLNIFLFTEQIFEVGRGGFGRCYLGKICSGSQEELAADLHRSYQEILTDKNVVVVKKIQKNKNINDSQTYAKQIENLSSVHQGNTKKESQNIVKVYPYKIQTENNFYIVMQYCYQSTLGDLIESRKKDKKTFNLAQFLAIMQNLLSGYNLLYQKNIVHNDLKPQNIFIKDGKFKIGDFGISMRLGSNQHFVPSHCTLLYSPIQKIERKQNINHKADIYSLGLILGQIMFGKHIYFDLQSWKMYWKQHSSQYGFELDEEFQVIHIDAAQIIQNNRSLKEKERKMFVAYLQRNMKGVINPQVVLSYDYQHTQFVKELQTLILDMCRSPQKRPTLKEVQHRILKLPEGFHNVMAGQSKFPDLHKLRDSELNFHIQNIQPSQMSYLIRKDSIKSKEVEKLSLITFDKVEYLRNKLTNTSLFVKVLYLATLNLKPKNQNNIKDRLDIDLLKLELYAYLYWVNRVALLEVSQEATHIKFHELSDTYRQNFDKTVKVSQLDDQYLSQLVFINSKQNKLSLSRSEVKRWLNDKYLGEKAILLNDDSFQCYFWLFIVTDLMKSEQTLSKDLIKWSQQMDIIQQNMRKIQDENFGCQELFQQRNHQFLIIWQCSQ